MDRLLRFWAPAAALGLIIGCAGEEGVETPAPSAPAPAPTPTPDEIPAPPPVTEAPKTDEAPPLTPAEEPKVEEAKPAEEPKAEEAPSLDGPSASAAELSEEEIAEIKKLPAEDQALALAQAVCPVSGENLGSMDVPVKTSIDGRDFFICCNGCAKKVKSDPKGVLTKLDAK